jgi:hypothetical protein
MPRLLRPQPGGFEGFGVAWEIAEADDLAVPKRGQLRDLAAEVQFGDSACSGEFAQREDRIAEVADVVESSLQLKVTFEALPGLSDSGVPSILLQECGPLDLGVEGEIVGEPLAAGDRVIVRWNWHGTGRGPQSDMEWTVIFSTRNGRIFGVEYFWHYPEALDAAGLQE